MLVRQTQYRTAAIFLNAFLSSSHVLRQGFSRFRSPCVYTVALFITPPRDLDRSTTRELGSVLKTPATAVASNSSDKITSVTQTAAAVWYIPSRATGSSSLHI